MKLTSRATKLLCVLALLAGCGPDKTEPEPKARPAVKPKAKPDAKNGATPKKKTTDPKKGPTSDKPPKADPPEKVTASKESVVKVKRLLRRWSSEVDTEREEAWQGLKDMGDLATPALIEVVKAGKPKQRLLAIVAIGLLQDKLGASALRGALGDKSAEIRWNAARALGEIGDKGARDLLAKAVKEDKDLDVRYYAAYSLASLGGKEAFEFFKAQLKSEKPVDRSRAVRALGKYGKGAYVPELIAAMNDKDARVRRATVIQLDRSRRKTAVPGLIAALADKDYRVRKRARSALERLTKKDFGANKAKWEEWWKKDGKTFKVPTGPAKPKVHKWANATALKGEADFKKKVTGAKGWVLVMFYTTRGKDCSRQSPVFDKLAKEYKGKLAMYEAEARANTKTIRALGLRKAPSTVVFKDGKKIEVLAGFKDEAAFKKIIGEHLAGTRKVVVQKAPGKPKKTFPDATQDAEFEKKVTNAKGLVLVDFHADWCGWCHKLTPTLNKLSAEYKGKISFVGVDTDKNKPLMKKFGVRGLPTMIIFKDGKKAETIVGYKPEAALKAILEKHLKAGGAK